MWHIYIIECSDNALYTGTTNNLIRRIQEHNDGKGGSYTRIRTPVKLAFREPHSNRSQALKREAQIKRWSHSKKLALIKNNKSILRELSKSRDNQSKSS